MHNRLPEQDEADDVKNNGGILVKLWRCDALWLLFHSFCKNPECEGKNLFCHVIPPRSWRQQGDIHRFKFKPGFIGVWREISFRGLQEIFVIAVREVWFVMRAAGL